MRAVCNGTPAAKASSCLPGLGRPAARPSPARRVLPACLTRCLGDKAGGHRAVRDQEAGDGDAKACAVALPRTLSICDHRHMDVSVFMSHVPRVTCLLAQPRQTGVLVTRTDTNATAVFMH